VCLKICLSKIQRYKKQIKQQKLINEVQKKNKAKQKKWNVLSCLKEWDVRSKESRKKVYLYKKYKKLQNTELTVFSSG